MKFFKITFSLLVLMAIVSGCATDQNSQQSASPTVSGYIDVGGQKSLGH